MMFSIAIDYDPSGQASKWSAQAEKARMFGNMREASELHAKAGAVLEADVANKIKRSEKDVIRFLAATQYYLGGHYIKAEEICRKIQANLLPDARLRELYGSFLKAVRERAKPDYAQKVRERLARHWQRHKYQEIIDLLKEHLFVIENDCQLAEIRGRCLERLGDYDAAALFLSNAVSKAPDDPQMLLFFAAAPLHLLGKKPLADAWEYAQKLLAQLPHPLTTLTAAIVRFHQAVQTEDRTEKQRLHEEQLRLFHHAEGPFFQLPTAVQERADYRELMTLGFLDAVLAYCYLGNLAQATEVFKRVAAFAPDDHLVHTLGTTLQSPQPDAEEATRKVIDFGKAIAKKFAKDESPFAPLAA